MSGNRTIGRLAEEAGVNVETVRYYQRRGLMPEPPKPRGGFRTYGEEAVARLRFIQRAQRLGFTLREVAELLDLGDGACEEVREHATAKRAEIEARIRDLEAMRAELTELEERCHQGQQGGCALVKALSDSPG